VTSLWPPQVQLQPVETAQLAFMPDNGNQTPLAMTLVPQERPSAALAH